MLSKLRAGRSVQALVIALTIPLLAGCVAEQRISWSPDGNKLAVVGSDGVRVSLDGGMHLGNPVEEDATIVSWFPDSKRLLVVSKAGYTTWNDLEKHVDRAELEKIKTTAMMLLNQLEQCNGNFIACRDALLKQHVDSKYLTQALFYLRINSGEKMQAAVGHEWRAFKLSDPFASVSSVNVYEVDANSSLHQKQKLTETTNVFESAKVSPSGDYAFLVDNNNNLNLVKTGANAKGLNEICSDVFKLPDWDFNTDVIYGIRKIQQKSGKLSTAQTELFSVDAAKPTIAKRLSGVTSNNDKVKATVDGNLIYGSSVSVARPKAKSITTAQTLNLFSLTSGKSRRIYQAVGDDQLQSFDVSPDGKNISIAGATGGLKVIEVKTGKVRVLSPHKLKDAEDIFAPVWRNNDEICFENIKPNGSEGHVALFSMKKNAIRGISQSWPMETLMGVSSMQNEKRISFERMIDDLKDSHKQR